MSGNNVNNAQSESYLAVLLLPDVVDTKLNWMCDGLHVTLGKDSGVTQRQWANSLFGP